MRLMLCIGVLALGACKGNDVESDTDPDTEPPEFGNGLSNGDTPPAREADTVLKADLSDGALIDLDWAATGGMGCWAEGENVNFSGAHWFSEAAQPADTDLFLRVTPKADVDVSVYLIQLDQGTSNLPPDIQTAVACQAIGDFSMDSNPGTAEVTKLGGWDVEYRVVVGVAGAGGATDGAFQVELWHEPMQ